MRFVNPSSLVLNLAGRVKSLPCTGNVILFGYGNIGSILADIVLTNSPNNLIIVDNDSRKWGLTHRGIPISSIGDVSKDIISNSVFLISVTDIQDVILQLRAYTSELRWISVPDYLNSLSSRTDIDFQQYSLKQNTDARFLEYVWHSCIRYQDVLLNSDKPPLRSLELIVTERCTLKCKDCSNLMQYYSKPSNIVHVDIIAELESVLGCVSWINEVRVLGGEPFLNKDILQIYRFLNSTDKVRNVVTYTNGTLIPSPDVIEALSHSKNLVLVTDYGQLSRQKENLSQALNDAAVKFRVEPASGWTDCGTVVELRRSIDDLKQTFSECCAKNLVTLSNGSLYRCPFAAHLERLEFKDFPQDRLSLTDLSASNSDQLLHDFLFEKEYISACSYCKGRRLSDPKIVPGIQSTSILQLP